MDNDNNTLYKYNEAGKNEVEIMSNISILGENIKLEQGKYIVIDGLYINYIKDFLNKSISNNPLPINSIKEEVFPFTDMPFGIYEFNSNVEIGLKDIKRTKLESITNASDHYISIDTGIMAFISF